MDKTGAEDGDGLVGTGGGDVLGMQDWENRLSRERSGVGKRRRGTTGMVGMKDWVIHRYP